MSCRNRTCKRSLTLLAPLAVGLLAAGLAQAAGGEHKSQAEVLRETGWQAFNLVVIVALLIHFGRKPVADYFASRRQGIQTQLSQAADLLAQAEHRNSELQRKLVDLSAELDSIREASNRRAEEEALRILAEARATADRIRRDAQAAVDQELRRAQSKLREEAADLALELASRKLQSGVNDADRDRLMDEFITRVEPGSVGGVVR
ncbi:MAG: ATP synthase F0 subunit B [Deltaproteobacteria bacterium]|nr:ATP synthase F0 subunit B [Deltaproteobacteria bacterium]